MRHQSATSKVELTHRESGASLRFLPLEALRLVNAREDLIRVSYSASWLASRSENPHHNKIAHPYDWTYTTNYKGDIQFCVIIFLKWIIKSNGNFHRNRGQVSM